MQVDKYLKEYQTTIFKIFERAIKDNKLSHAYLLIGSQGTPLLETATYLAKSIICESPSPLACNNCMSCLRVDANTYPGLIICDGAKASIKKDDLENIHSSFEKTSIEKDGKFVYILNIFENSRPEVKQSILKFLEEPKQNVHAIITTSNENLILPTIISRCQILKLKQVDRGVVIRNAIDYGVEQDDAELMSYLYNDGQLINEIVFDNNRNKKYQLCKNHLNNLLEALNRGFGEGVFYFETQILEDIKDYESYKFFLDLLAEIFEDILNIVNQKEIILKTYDTILHKLSRKLLHIEETILEIFKLRNIPESLVNITLALDHLILLIVKE